MRELSLLLGNYTFFWAITVALIGFQSTIWLQLFGYFPSPHLWAPAIVFWILFRDIKEGIFMTYILAATVCTLSAIPIGLMLLVQLILTSIIYLLRLRIFWSGPTYFMMICGVYVGLFPVIHLLTSWLFEKNPIQDFLFFEWILRSLLTALFALPLYFLFSWFDKFTHKEQPTDLGSAIL